MQWKIIEGFDEYEISDTGLVHRLTKKSYSAYSVQKRKYTSYNRVTLFNKGKRYYFQIHRLVAKAFIPNPLKLPQIDHIDGNGQNNRKENLQWVTASENIKRSFKQNLKRKLQVCSLGGKAGAATMQHKVEQKYQKILGSRFIAFYEAGVLCKTSAVEYACECGRIRRSSIQGRELRTHMGKCPVCTETVNRSAKSL